MCSDLMIINNKMSYWLYLVASDCLHPRAPDSTRDDTPVQNYVVSAIGRSMASCKSLHQIIQPRVLLRPIFDEIRVRKVVDATKKWRFLVCPLSKHVWRYNKVMINRYSCRHDLLEREIPFNMPAIFMNAGMLIEREYELLEFGTAWQTDPDTKQDSSEATYSYDSFGGAKLSFILKISHVVGALGTFDMSPISKFINIHMCNQEMDSPGAIIFSTWQQFEDLLELFICLEVRLIPSMSKAGH